jgi:tetratricopeptide (TPR) repeat protein
VERLLKFSPSKIETYRLSSEYYLRAKDAKKAIEVIKKGLEISPNDVELHKTIIRLFSKEWSEEFIESEKKYFLGEFKSLEEYNNNYLKNSKSISQVTSALECCVLLDNKYSKEDAIKFIMEFDKSNSSLSDLDYTRDSLKKFFNFENFDF